MIIAVAAPSASGKTTIVNKVMDITGIRRLKTCTTRAKRPEEVGDEYYFMSRNEFELGIMLRKFVEFNEVFGNYYGLTYEEVESDGDSIIIQDIDGVHTLKSKFPEFVNSIFIMPPPKEELRKRLVGRNTGNLDDIELRLDRVDKEVLDAGWFDYRVEYGELDVMVGEFVELTRMLTAK